MKEYIEVHLTVRVDAPYDENAISEAVRFAESEIRECIADAISSLASRTENR